MNPGNSGGPLVVMVGAEAPDVGVLRNLAPEDKVARDHLERHRPARPVHGGRKRLVRRHRVSLAS